MKITKSQLKQIIKEELTEAGDWYSEEHETLGDYKFATDESDRDHIDYPGEVNARALWQDLNILLNDWPDKEHPYYKDLRTAMEAYSEEDSRPETEEEPLRISAPTGPIPYQHQR